VKRVQKRRNVVGFRRAKDKSSCMVLDPLEFGDEIIRTARKESVTIIQARKYKGTEKSFSRVLREEVTDGRNSTDLIVAGFTDVSNVLIERESLIKGDTEIAGSGRQRNVGAAEGNRRR
jgi:hypothetical protein